MTESEVLTTPDEQVGADTLGAVCEVSTSTRCQAGPPQLWRAIQYYEQISERPPLLLRWLLPVPVRTVGSKSTVGDEARCEYVEGFLQKRVTEIEAERLYRFAVVDQALPFGRIRLSGGAYRIAALPEGGSELTLETCYSGGRSPRWLWKPIEALVCHAFHRHILRAMVRAAVTTPAALPASGSPEGR